MATSSKADVVRQRQSLEQFLTDAGFDGAGHAERLVRRYGSLSEALHSDPDELTLTTGDKRLVRLLSSTCILIDELHRADLRCRPVVRIDSDLITYLRFAIGYGATEQLSILYLDGKSKLIAEETHTDGTYDQVALHVREILARAIRLGAAGLIIAHNHPSVEAKPSEADIQVTRKLCVAAKALDLSVYDHIILARDQWCSLRSLGLM